MKIAIFDQPIPGQSLCGEPKNNPWEQPAEMSDVEEITKYYINNMANDDVIDDLAAVCQTGLSLKPIVDTIVSVGNMNGLHSVDAGMLVKPVIHEFLKQAITSTRVSIGMYHASIHLHAWACRYPGTRKHAYAAIVALGCCCWAKA